MKYNKTITLELDILLKLNKEGNASELIGKLLRKHFESEEIDKVFTYGERPDVS